ncbi:MAG: class I adenylate-forming enzyme family protein, partial [Candidatus Omnitrophota bacterium]
MNIFDHFSNNVKKHPDKTAFICQEESFTFGELQSLSLQLSAFLWEKGVRKGTKIAVLLNNSIDFALCILAAARLGAVIVPMNPTLPIENVKGAFFSTDVEFAIMRIEILRRYEGFDKLLPSEKILSFGETASASFREIYGSCCGSTTAPYDVEADSDFLITMTSGSTSDPKPIVLSHGTKIKRAIDGAKDIYNLSDADIIMIGSPMYHSLAFRLTLLPLLLGGTGIILPKFTPKIWLETVEDYKVTFTIAVSSQLEMILNEVRKNSYDLTSLEKIVSSSAILKPEIKTRIISKLDCEFHECYGTSEIGIATNLSPKDSVDKLNSVGKPLPHVDIKIVDEYRKELPIGEEGEIVCKTVTIFSSYYKKEEETKKSIKEGYFYTGDIGKFDDDGFLYYIGRKKDIIITGGINVYPKDIEDILWQFDGIQEFAVIGVDDLYFGEAILAVIVADKKI